MKLLCLFTLIIVSVNAQNPRSKKQTDPWEFFKVDNPEEHHGHSHHHHPDAHFPLNKDHHHHGTDQTDHTADHHQKPTVLVVRTEHKEPQVSVTAIKPAPIVHHVTHNDHTGHLHGPDELHNVHSADAHNGHVHPDPHHHKAPPGYPSSDFAKYFAQYTSRGGDPKEAVHSYYRDHHGHLANYNVEPEYTRQGRQSARLTATAHATDTRAPDPNASQRNFVSSGNNFHYSSATGQVESPSGNGPHHGFAFNQPGGGKLLVGNTVIRF